MAVKQYSRSFAGGVVSPEMFGRIDDVRHSTGLALCYNAIVQPQGPVISRSGTRYVATTKNSAAAKSRILPFQFSTTQTVVVEQGVAHMRFYSYGQPLMTPAADLWNDVDTYTHGGLAEWEGFIWYAATAVPANKQPDLFEYGAGTPVVSVTWQPSTALLDTPPVGYTLVGGELPAVAVDGQQVYTTTTTWEQQLLTTWEDEAFRFDTPVLLPVIKYQGYTGVAVVSTEDYWYKLGSSYEIPSPYAEEHLFELKYTQSGDVVTITHQQYAPRELRRLGATTWVLVPIVFASTLTTPATPTLAATTVVDPGDLQTYRYVTTRTNEDGTDESLPSGEATVGNQLADPGASNLITVGTTDRVNVYKYSGGLFGFIGQTTGGSLVDDNIAPDVSRTPPQGINPFVSDWPGAVGYAGQRRVFAGTPLLAQAAWLTRAGTESNLNYSIPARADDAISVKIAARKLSSIRHIVPLGDLLLLTSGGEFRLTSSGGPLSPLSIEAPPPRTHVGANHVQPALVDSECVFAAARGGHLYGIGFSFEQQGYISVDLSLRAAHLFDNRKVVDLAFARAPAHVVWAVSSTGEINGLSYVPSEQVLGFHVQSTLYGKFESVCVVEEGDEDVLYAVVLREFPDVPAFRCIERFAERLMPTQADWYYMDCGVTQVGDSDEIDGLDHLEGVFVSVLVDGAVQAPRVVSGGKIVLDGVGNKRHAGVVLPRILQTLPIVGESVEAFGQGHIKTVNSASFRVKATGAFRVGPAGDRLREVQPRTDEAWGVPAQGKTGVVDVTLDADWNDDGQILIINTDPTPLHIMSMTLDLEYGG